MRMYEAMYNVIQSNFQVYIECDMSEYFSEYFRFIYRWLSLKAFIYPKLNIVQINPIVMNYSNKHSTDSSTNASTATEKRKRRKSQPLSANDRTDLVFPRNRELFEVVNDKFHLRDLITEENKKHHIDLQTHSYCFERGPRSYMYTKCIPCGHKLKLKYRKFNNPGQKFKLIFFDNTHNHTNFCKKSKHHYNMNEVFQEMKKAPKNMMIDQFREHLKQRFGINDSHFYYMLSKFRKCHESIKMLIDWFKKQQCFLCTNIKRIDDPQPQQATQMGLEEDPEFFMLVLPKMAENYKRYGECCYFNVMKGLIKKKTNFDNCEWLLISFNGLSFNNRFAPFALAFLKWNEFAVDNIVQIIKRFFNKYNKIPKTIITPYQDIFFEIMDKLDKNHIFKGLHIFDGVEQLQQIRRVINDVNQVKYFEQVIWSTCKAEYNYNLLKLQKNLLPTLQVRMVFNDLQKKAPKMCFALIQTDGFVGMGFKYSANRYMSILVRYLFTHNNQGSTPARPKDLYSSIRFLSKEYIKLMEPELTYIRYDTWKFEQYMNIPEMLLIRNNLKMAIMDIFLAEFHKVFELDARQRETKDPECPSMKIYDIFDKRCKSLFVVAARPEYDFEGIFQKCIWKCNCLYSVKCGMPCCHQIKVVMMNNGSLLDQVNQRWVQPKIGRKKAPGRPKISRRNMMK